MSPRLCTLKKSNRKKENMATYNSGEIYFIRECEYKTGIDTSFVKIGLVRYKEGRDSWGRLNEHQTGNPRKLSLSPDHVVRTEAVDLVEARLHREFARKRILGEWFEFENDRTLFEAVSRAQEISAEVGVIVDSFDQANALKYQPSNGLKREPNPEEKTWGANLAIAKAQEQICKDFEGTINSMLTKAFTEGRDVSPYSKVVVRPFVPTFLEDEFKLAHPDIWSKYLSEEKDWHHRFLPKVKIDLEVDLGDLFYQQIDGIKAAIESARATSDLSLLTETSLTLASLRGIAEWEVKTNQTKLQVALAEFEEISGICTWKRVEKIESKFNSKVFASEQPDLYRSFVSAGVAKTRVAAKKSRS